MQNVVKKERSSNLELFRIISMLLIVSHHYVVNSGIMTPMHESLLNWQSFFLFILGAWGKTGINCFVLITGYFMCKSQISLKKFAKLVLEVELYKVIIYFIFVFTGYTKFSVLEFGKTLLPITSIGQNFVGCFLVFYLLIPFLNILIKSMNEKQHLYLVLLLLFVYVGLGTVFGASIEMNYVTWFTVLYIVASYIRLYPKELFENTKFWGIMAALSVLFALASIVGLNFVSAIYHVASANSLMTDSNKICAFLVGFTSFMFFKNVKIKQSRFINTVAASAFGVLLIHSNSVDMRKWLWIDTLKVTDMYGSKYLVLHAVVCIVSVYVICTIIDYLRIVLIEKPFFKFWDRHLEGFFSRFSGLESKVCEKLKIGTK